MVGSSISSGACPNGQKKRLNRTLKMSQSDQKQIFRLCCPKFSTLPPSKHKCQPNARNGPSTKTFDMFPPQNVALIEVLRTSIVFFTGHSRPNTIQFLLNYLNKVSFSQKGRTLLSLQHQLMVIHGFRIQNGKRYPRYRHRL